MRVLIAEVFACSTPALSPVPNYMLLSKNRLSNNETSALCSWRKNVCLIPAQIELREAITD